MMYNYSIELKNIPLTINTGKGIFSPEKPDKGTLAMLSEIEFTENDKVLDLGCGAGLVGILAARIIGVDKVVMSDINPEAVKISEKNAELNGVGDIKIYQSDGFSSFQDRDFTLILNNPPYHEDFSVAKHFIEKGFNRLAMNGKMVMVTKRRDWYKNKLISIFGGVSIAEIDGYFVFKAEKRSMNYSLKKKKN